LNLRGEVGYQHRLNNRIALEGWIGYTYDQVLLYLRDDKFYGDQKLNSSYESYWKGLLFSLGGTLQFGKRYILRPRASYQQLHYHANADWNLIEAFEHPKSFEHHAKGYGITGTLQIGYTLSKRIDLYLLPQYTFAETGRGTDTVFLKSGDTQKTQLNGVARTNYKLQLGVELKF
jgi:predicted porin